MDNLYPWWAVIKTIATPISSVQLQVWAGIIVSGCYTLRRSMPGSLRDSGRERVYLDYDQRYIPNIGSESRHILPRQVLWSANGLFRPIRILREQSEDEVSGILEIQQTICSPLIMLVSLCRTPCLGKRQEVIGVNCSCNVASCWCSFSSPILSDLNCIWLVSWRGVTRVTGRDMWGYMTSFLATSHQPGPVTTKPGQATVNQTNGKKVLLAWRNQDLRTLLTLFFL